MSVQVAPLHAGAGQSYPAGALSVSSALLFAFLIAMPMVNVLGPSVWLAPPMVMGIALLAWLALCGRLFLDDIYIAVVCMVTWCFLQWPLSAGYMSSKTLLHAVGILGATAVFYMSVRSGLVEALREGRAMSVLKWVYAALFMTSTFILMEVTFTNVLGLNWSAVVPYIEVSEFKAFGAAGLLRARGFASEPGIMALFYDFGFFFVMPLLRERRYRLGFLLVILPGYLLLMSAASITICAVVAAALGLRRLWHRFGSTAGRILIVSTVLALALAPFAQLLWSVADEMILGRIGAIAGGGGSESGRVRLGVYQEILESLSIRPFGIGFGITAGLADVGGTYEGMPLRPGQISLFGMFAMAGGVPAFMLLVIVILVSIRRVLRDPVFGVPIAAGGVAISVHQIFVTEFWLPFFWFFLAAANAFASTRTLRNPG